MLKLSEKNKFLIEYYLLLFFRGFVFLKNYLIILLDNNLSPLEVGMVLSVGIITNVLLSIPISTMSTKFGNKNMFIAGLLLFLFSYLLLMFRMDMYTFMFYSIGDAIFDIVSFSSRESLIYNNIKHHNLTRSFAEYRSLSKLFKLSAATISTFIAGDLIYISPRGVFAVDIFVLFLTMLTVLRMKDTNDNKICKINIRKSFKYMFKHTTLLKCFMHRVIWHSIFLITTTYRSFFYEELAVNDRNINLMVSFQIFLVTVLQVIFIKKLSKRSIFLGYFISILSSLFMLFSYCYYSGMISYVSMICYYVFLEVSGDLTYPQFMSFIPKKEMPIILSSMNLVINGIKLIFLNIFTIIATYFSYKTAFISLASASLAFSIIGCLFICLDKHMLNISNKKISIA